MAVSFHSGTTVSYDRTGGVKPPGLFNDYGRPSAIDIEDFKIHYQKVIDGQIRPTDLMKQLGISKSTYYRYVERIKALQ